MNDKTPKPQADAPRLPAIQNRIITAGADIHENPHAKAVYQHGLLCQIALPRRRPEGRVFERRYKRGLIRIEAGALWDGLRMAEQPLPAGPKPRLALIHINNQAIKTRCPVVELERSARAFMERLGLNTDGGKDYYLFKRELKALAACRMTLGFTSENGPTTLNTQIIRRFEAWLTKDDGEPVFWPGEIELSRDYFEELLNHAVPLDPRAIAALAHSALAIDAYCFLARRMCTLTKPVKVFWHQWHEQFGQEYTGPDAVRNFKKKWLSAVRAALTVYPSAKVELVGGGLLLKPSPPPVHPEALSKSYSLPKQVCQPQVTPGSIKPETVERFRALYPRLDPYACEADFRVWVEAKEQPRDFDKAFLGFAKQWGKSGG